MKQNNRIIFSEVRTGLKNVLGDKKTVYITDKKVHGLYKELLPGNRTVVMPSGERSKNLRTVEKIYSFLTGLEADRSTVIVGIGGGVVCDIAGFVSSTYKRGTGLILVPTTLLAQVDAAIGGKNGVDFKGFKNMIGSFREPDSIIIDTTFLSTLDKRNFNNGAAELIKTALIADGELFAKISNTPISEMKEKQLLSSVKRAAGIKNSVVRKDPYDRGYRKILNFGHTIGHAIELHSGKMLHGEAVSVGIVCACWISEKLTGFKRTETEKIIKVLQMNRLPVKLPASITPDIIMSSLVQDKKRNSGNIDIVLLKDIGEPLIHSLKIKEIKGIINDLC
ncbi:MAG: 3-dehydroquinate synthase [Spirochaetes bacterium]|nr:3-dehydroquinate synthase [Spirochaetota bacterium]